MARAAPGQPSLAWQRFVDRSPIGSLVVVAFIATQLGTYFGYVFEAVGLPRLPWPIFNGLLGANATEWESAEQFFVGHTLHFVNGLVFGVLYGILFRGILGWTRTNRGNIGMGLVYGLIMTIISAGLLVPYAYVPEQGYGLFLFDGPDEWKLPLAILVWHLIYGFFLGSLYQPSEDRTDVTATV